MDDPAQSQPEEEKRRIKSPLIVGLGASAGAMNSIERFFSKLTVEPDQAIVLVLQYRDAIDEARLREALGRTEGNGVVEIKDGLEVTGGAIYICPSDVITTIQGDHFAVRPATQARGERATIDSFLVSLAEERAEESIGVVLAGTGGDGTLGTATLKDHGGLALAEKVVNENSDHLADSSTPAAIADFVLPPED